MIKNVYSRIHKNVVNKLRMLKDLNLFIKQYITHINYMQYIKSQYAAKSTLRTEAIMATIGQRQDISWTVCRSIGVY